MLLITKTGNNNLLKNVFRHAGWRRLFASSNVWARHRLKKIRLIGKLCLLFSVYQKSIVNPQSMYYDV
jgi:hypothetical protein